MKNYVKPEIIEEELVLEDIIAASVNNEDRYKGEGNYDRFGDD